MPHGQFAWNELVTKDVEAAKQFYAELLGWSYEPMPMPDGGTYWLAKSGDKVAGGLMTMDGVPSNWMPYVEVDDVDARVAKVAANGGTVMRPAFDIPDVGRIAILTDATGAPLGLMTPVAR
jgi:predicted enzyme related to lactoylglutathione lyase